MFNRVSVLSAEISKKEFDNYVGSCAIRDETWPCDCRACSCSIRLRLRFKLLKDGGFSFFQALWRCVCHADVCLNDMHVGHFDIYEHDKGHAIFCCA